jgi:hypothetical protein
LSCTSTNSSTLTQFIERFQALEESGVEIKAKHIRKAPASHKSSRSNIDDTNTEDNINSCEAAVSQRTWKDEWVMYLNTNDDVLDAMDVVRWWGVSFILLYLCASLILPFIVAEWYLIPDVAFSRARLSCCFSLICGQQVCFLFSRHHHQQALQPPRC